MASSFFLVTLAFAVLSAVKAWQPDYILRVSNSTIYSDCQPRVAAVVNGTTPGPLLTFKEGEHYWIRVFNDLPDSNTTIHWHGFAQFTSPFSDGTPLTSGWPIPPGHFYDYEFQLEDGFYGTYWYHSHVDMQVQTAQGPIIVYPKDNSSCPVKYDEDIVMMMGDYYHADDATILAGLLNETVFGWLNEPQNLLVNGNALGTCNATALMPGQMCGTACGNNLQKVKPGKKYRVRMIGATVLSYLGMALEGHNMTLFEVDGTWVDVYSRPRDTFGYYWRIRTMWRTKRVNGSALWQYDEAAPSTAYVQAGPVSNATTPTDLNMTVLLPNETFGWVSLDIVPHNKTIKPPTQAEVSRTIYLDGQQLVAGNGFRWSVSNFLYNPTTNLYNGSNAPTMPYLLGFYTEPESERKANYTAAKAYGGYDPGSNTWPAQIGEVLDLVIQNVAGPTSGLVESHPWHAHGQKYWDMGAGMGNFSYAALNASLAARTGIPFQRDTSIAYSGPGESYNYSMIGDKAPGGWRLLRINVTDPGAWLIHCHMAPHQAMGMQALFMYGAEDLASLPDSLVKEYTTFGGGAFGDKTYDGYVPKSYFEEVKKHNEKMKREEKRKRAGRIGM